MTRFYKLLLLLIFPLGLFAQDIDYEEMDIEEEIVEEEIYRVVEKMPLFGDCEDEACSQMALVKFLQQLEYPKDLRQAGVEGKVYTSFVITSEGKVKDVKILRSPEPAFSESVIKLLEKMPDWTPGQQRGKNVSVMYTLPVNFQL